LVELGLTVKSKGRQSNEGLKLRAREMAGNAIDDMTDTTAHADDQASRKRRLLKGPEEFRDVRVDRERRWLAWKAEMTKIPGEVEPPKPITRAEREAHIRQQDDCEQGSY
jgi:hypothetical protein